MGVITQAIQAGKVHRVMVGLRLDTKKYFEIPYNMFDVVLQMRGAIDPDSGQIICHFYSLGATVIETEEGRNVPVIVAEGCLMATFGPENVKTILEEGEAREISSIRVTRGRLILDDMEIDHYWGITALIYAREMGSPVRFYKLRLSIDDEDTNIAGILVEETDSGPLLLLIPRSCEYIEEREELPTHM
ncbi:MAG: hypothetical protein DSY37_04195 [Hyperthermus sp.]|nr:MAG: hypothetical protein DSY37_04195 [Hyperthermus sp.]